MGHQVELAIYDLSNGIARELSPAFIGKRIGGIWHTGICVYGREYYFGGGICVDAIGNTPFGGVESRHMLGTTNKSVFEFEQFLQSIQSRFSMTSYHFLDNNCNHFTDCCSMFLVNSHIPQHILDLPGEALNSPIGPMLRSMVDGMQRTIIEQSMSHQVNFNRNAPVASTSSNTAVATPTSHANSSEVSQKNSEATALVTNLVSNPVRLASGNVTGIRNKLKSIDGSLPRTVRTGEDASALVNFALKSSSSEAFPALDLLRLSLVTFEGEQTESFEKVTEQVSNNLLKLFEKFALTEFEDATYGAQLMTLRLAVNLFAIEKGWQKAAKDAEKLTGAVEACGSALAAWGESANASNASNPSNAKISKSRLNVATAGAVLLRNVCTVVYKTKTEDEDVTTRALFIAHEFVSKIASEGSLASSVDDKWVEQVCGKVVTPVLQAILIIAHDNDLAMDVLHAYEFDDAVMRLVSSSKARADDDFKLVTRCLTESVLRKQ